MASSEARAATKGFFLILFGAFLLLAAFALGVTAVLTPRPGRFLIAGVALAGGLIAVRLGNDLMRGPAADPEAVEDDPDHAHP
jgi:hypothetical protein